MLGFLFCSVYEHKRSNRNSHKNPLRVGDDLCQEENDSAIKRKNRMARTFHTLCGRDDQMSVEEVPIIFIN